LKSIENGTAAFLTNRDNRTDRIWLKSYPKGVPADINVSQYTSLVALMEESFKTYANKVGYSFIGKNITYATTDSLSQAFAEYLQGLGLVKGDRVAIMMPNVPQYPVAVAGILRAGYVVVNVNPLYTPRELEYQLKDSGAKAIVIIENFANTLEKCIAATPVKHIVLCAMGDQLGLIKGALVNYVVRHKKEAGARVQFANGGALQRSGRPGDQRGVQKAQHQGRRCRGAAVHRGHYGRLQGGRAAAPQRDCQCAAVGGVEQPRYGRHSGR